MEYLLPYLCMVTVPHIMVGLERMLDYRGVGLARFHCSDMMTNKRLQNGMLTRCRRGVVKAVTLLFRMGHICMVV